MLPSGIALRTVRKQAMKATAVKIMVIVHCGQLSHRLQQ
jgi:hypothetical protein